MKTPKKQASLQYYNNKKRGKRAVGKKKNGRVRGQRKYSTCHVKFKVKKILEEKKKKLRVFSVLSSVGGSGVGTVCISLFVSLVNYP